MKGEIIDSVGKVIELNDLSEALDNLMVEKMRESGISGELTNALYKKIYRACNNYSDRVYQIDLMVDTVERIHHVSRMRFIGLSLKAVSRAAHFAGMGKIMDFLQQGE